MQRYAIAVDKELTAVPSTRQTRDSWVGGELPTV